jgi:hypothetical protein
VATRSPTQIHPYWGIYATSALLPNVAGSPTQKATLQVGDQAYVSSESMPYYCTTATLGAAVWSAFGMGLGPANFDAFSRLRTSAPSTIFDSKLIYDTQPQFWTEAGTGTSTWSQPDARVRLAVTPGQTRTRQTKRWFTYEPGKSQLVLVTFNLNGASVNVSKRVGQFSDTDGIFLEIDGAGTVNLVRRSGSSVPTVTVPQAAWNLDKLDGTGPSGLTLDLSKTQILVIDYQWLGVGTIRIGFQINGTLYYVQQFNNANTATGTAVYMSTPNLPIRYQIVSTTGSGNMDCICATVISEGGQSEGTSYSYPRNTTTPNIASGASAGILHIRPYATNPRVTIKPVGMSLLNNANSNTLWQLVINPTFANPQPVFAAPGSPMNYCDLSDTITGAYTANTGIIIASGLMSSLDRQTDLLDFANPAALFLGTDVAGTTVDFVSLIVTNLGNNNETYRATISWIAIP